MPTKSKRDPRPASAASAWLVETSGGGPLGEVEAIDREGALAEAARRWPDAGRLHVTSKPAVERLLLKLQSGIDRDPGQVAYHESGHAVIGIAGGRRLDRVVVGATFYVARGHDSTGRTEWEADPASPRLSDHRQRPVAEARIMTCMAGPIAEARHRGLGRRLLPGHSDLACIQQLALPHCGGFLPPPSGIGNIVQDRYLAWLDSRARMLVDSLWPQIERVAGALIEHRVLSGPRVLELMAEVGRGPVDDLFECLRDASP